VRALVIGDDTRSFLAIVRSLGRDGWNVDAAPFDFSSPALSSHYLGRIHRVDPYSLSAERWVERLRSLAANWNYDLIVPCDDRALIPLARHADALAPTRLALPNPASIAAFFDKVETRRLATSLGLPVAPGRLLVAGDSSGSLVRDFGLPLALKPRSSYVLGQAGSKSSVRIVRTATMVDAVLEEISRPTEWLVEGFFHGEGCGLSVLADRGEIAMTFQHRRLTEASESGGSSIRMGEPVEPHLFDMVEAMARATELHGVAMFEFRRDRRTGRTILLEVNCRFWGSLPLAVASGADFPAAAARLHVRTPLPRATGYRPGLVMRDLGGEYNRIMIAASGRGSQARKAIAAAAGFATLAPAIMSGRGNDSYAPDDAGPFRRERAQLARHIVAAVIKRLAPPAFRRARGRAALRTLRRRGRSGAGTFVMLCHGNICRSPFAELRLREKARAAGLPLHVVSAGSYEAEGRRSPNDAVAAALRLGVDLSAHRSRFIDAEGARRAATVIVFDDRNVDEVRRLGIARDVNLLRLPDLIGRREIDDPYGRGPECFDHVYADIDEAIDRLVAALVRHGEKR
jgi:protein-tyrosine-phosphatase/predicted ATP-grasp superfamily ATP-dependent carboligase